MNILGCQINITKEEICKWLNVSETTLDAGYNAHYQEMVTAFQTMVDSGQVQGCPF